MPNINLGQTIVATTLIDNSLKILIYVFNSTICSLDNFFSKTLVLNSFLNSIANNPEEAQSSTKTAPIANKEEASCGVAEIVAVEIE